MKILLTIEDISYGRGAERVTVNLANALSGGHEVTILSFYQRHPTLPYTNINPQVNLIFKYNYEQSIAQESAKKQFFKGLYYKNIHKILLSYEMRKADYDFVISSGFIYFPYFKNPKTRYIKIIHTNFHRYSSRNKYFDMLITLSNKELPLWQQYHKNVKMIPNFIPQIPQESTNYKQKVIISVGSLTAEKGFLRLLDIWGMVQEMIANPNANRKSPTSSLRGARSEASATKQSKSSDLKRQSESRIEKQINADSLQVRDSQKAQILPDRLPRESCGFSRNDDSSADCHDFTQSVESRNDETKAESHTAQNKNEPKLRPLIVGASGLSLGISIVVAILLGIGAGILMQKIFGVFWVLFLGVAWGIAAAILNVYKVYKAELRDFEKIADDPKYAK